MIGLQLVALVMSMLMEMWDCCGDAREESVRGILGGCAVIVPEVNAWAWRFNCASLVSIYCSFVAVPSTCSFEIEKCCTSASMLCGEMHVQYINAVLANLEILRFVLAFSRLCVCRHVGRRIS